MGATVSFQVVSTFALKTVSLCVPKASLRSNCSVNRKAAVPPGLSHGGRRAGLEGGLGVSKDADGEVLDVGGPLGCQLEELHVVPLHAIDEDCGDKAV